MKGCIKFFVFYKSPRIHINRRYITKSKGSPEKLPLLNFRLHGNGNKLEDKEYCNYSNNYILLGVLTGEESDKYIGN